MRPVLMQTISSEDLDEIASSLEKVQVTWATAISAGLIVIIAFLAGRLARRSIRELGERLEIASPDVFKLAGRTAAYLIALMGIAAALGVLGFDVIPLVSALGVLAIVLAIGLQPLIEDFAAGVTLQTRRPFETGDQVAILGMEGTVLDVTSRTVLIESVAGEYVHVPNRTVLDSPFTIFTALDARRSTLDVGLDYASDLQQATQLLREAASNTPGV
ncbi:MAG TPA: mechanosensitive ion channel domain-containing protein, partial [Acidimicrobiia bacterium]|nr:mechanosensitive ion channel domain-containing protein [Acidimicrobiia bacterium]